MIHSLYIHIPFCEHICSYCDFPKVLCGTFSQEDYIKTLITDIDSLSIPDNSLRTIYIGGGTPSALSLDCLKTLLSYLSKHFPSVEEFTMEANPESLTEEKIALAKISGVNRISLGVQTANEKLLFTLNRKHNNQQVASVIKNLNEYGIENYNLDFIYGLPGQVLEDIDKDLAFALSLKPKHLSFYSLQIEEGTLLYNKKVKPCSDDNYAQFYEHVVQSLKEAGFQRYEISNFALPTYESKHNLTYWHDEYYYAAGLGASGYLPSLRYKNTASMNHYLKHQFRYQEETITPEDEEFEFLMLNLRLTQGFLLEDFKRRFQKDFLFSYQQEIEKVKPYVQISNGRFAIKEKYLYTMDQILLELLKLPQTDE